MLHNYLELEDIWSVTLGSLLCEMGEAQGVSRNTGDVWDGEIWEYELTISHASARLCASLPYQVQILLSGT